MATTDNSDHLTEMFSRRLIFVMGKGGVGKTTLAIALAYAARAMGKRVLLAETEENRSISRYFNQKDLGEAPVVVSDNIRIARVNPKSELETYTHVHVKSRFISRRITRSRLFDYLAEATPGLKEVMTLGRIWRWEAAKDSSGRPVHDLVIIDAPATGHGLSLLRLPKLLIEMIRIGPVVAQIRDLQAVLQNERITWLSLVTLPEELPVKESAELMAVARDQIGIPVRNLFLNGVYSDLFTDNDSDRIEALSNDKTRQETASSLSEPEGFENILEAARHQLTWQQIHEGYLNQLNKEADCPVISIPYYFTNDLTDREIQSIAALLQPSKREVKDRGNAGKDR